MCIKIGKKLGNREVVYRIFDKINEPKNVRTEEKKTQIFEFDKPTMKGPPYDLSDISLGLVYDTILGGNHAFDIMVILESHG